jgi:cyclic-di-GMP phosphodiesterase TipF (flagellum assembly factor)
MRLGSIFVAVCMMLIAGSGGAVAFFAFGATPSTAAAVAVAMLAVLALYNIVATQQRARMTTRREAADLANSVGDVAKHIAELGRRVAALEARVELEVHRPRPAPTPAADPLAFEFEELGTLVRQLADAVSAHEMQLAELVRAAQTPPRRHAEAVVATESPPLQGPAAALVAPPAVRKVRFYEVLARVRGERGEVIAAADFIGPAERARLLPQIDNLMMFRCVQVVRRLLAKNREVGLFCNISALTLTDAAVFTQLIEFLDANRAIAPSIVLEFTQSAIRDAGPIENESLEALAELGFRFSLDNVTDLRIDPRTLGARGFRFVKIPGHLLLDHGAGAAGDIHRADLADLLARFGLEMITDKVESEAAVVDLLEYDVRYGQGYLFSPPRPVRAEALQGANERDLVETTVPAITEPKAARTSGLAQLARRV